MLLLSSADFFKIYFSKKNFMNTTRVSNDLNPDQDRHSASPDLGLNCFLSFQQTTKVAASKERIKDERNQNWLLSCQPRVTVTKYDVNNCQIKH